MIRVPHALTQSPDIAEWHPGFDLSRAVVDKIVARSMIYRSSRHGFLFLGVRSAVSIDGQTYLAPFRRCMADDVRS